MATEAQIMEAYISIFQPDLHQNHSGGFHGFQVYARALISPDSVSIPFSSIHLNILKV